MLLLDLINKSLSQSNSLSNYLHKLYLNDVPSGYQIHWYHCSYVSLIYYFNNCSVNNHYPAESFISQIKAFISQHLADGENSKTKELSIISFYRFCDRLVIASEYYIRSIKLQSELPDFFKCHEPVDDMIKNLKEYYIQCITRSNEIYELQLRNTLKDFFESTSNEDTEKIMEMLDELGKYSYLCTSKLLVDKWRSRKVEKDEKCMAKRMRELIKQVQYNTNQCHKVCFFKKIYY